MATPLRVPNPRRPSAFQRWLSAGMLGMLVGMPVMLGLIFSVPDSLPRVLASLIALVPWLGVAGAYLLLERAWPEHLTLSLDDGRITGVGKEPLATGSGVVSVIGDYGRTPRNLTYEVYSIRYMPGDGAEAGRTLAGGCTDAVRVRDFAEALCRLGGYELWWRPPGSRERERRSPEDLGRSLGSRLAEAHSPAATPAEPALTRTRVEWLGQGALRVRTASPPLRFAAYVAVGFVVAAAATTALEMRNPGAWRAIGTGAVALLLALLLLLWVADALIVHEYHVGAGMVRGRSRVLGVPYRSWSVPAPRVESVYVHENDRAVLVAGAGFRRRIRLGFLLRPEELRWVAGAVRRALARAEAA